MKRRAVSAADVEDGAGDLLRVPAEILAGAERLGERFHRDPQLARGAAHLFGAGGVVEGVGKRILVADSAFETVLRGALLRGFPDRAEQIVQLVAEGAAHGEQQLAVTGVCAEGVLADVDRNDGDERHAAVFGVFGQTLQRKYQLGNGEGGVASVLGIAGVGLLSLKGEDHAGGGELRRAVGRGDGAEAQTRQIMHGIDLGDMLFLKKRRALRRALTGLLGVLEDEIDIFVRAVFLQIERERRERGGMSVVSAFVGDPGELRGVRHEVGRLLNGQRVKVGAESDVGFSIAGAVGGVEPPAAVHELKLRVLLQKFHQMRFCPRFVHGKLGVRVELMTQLSGGAEDFAFHEDHSLFILCRRGLLPLSESVRGKETVQVFPIRICAGGEK